MERHDRGSRDCVGMRVRMRALRVGSCSLLARFSWAPVTNQRRHPKRCRHRPCVVTRQRSNFHFLCTNRPALERGRVCVVSHTEMNYAPHIIAVFRFWKFWTHTLQSIFPHRLRNRASAEASWYKTRPSWSPLPSYSRAAQKSRSFAKPVKMVLTISPTRYSRRVACRSEGIGAAPTSGSFDRWASWGLRQSRATPEDAPRATTRRPGQPRMRPCTRGCRVWIHASRHRASSRPSGRRRLRGARFFPPPDTRRGPPDASHRH